MAKFTFVAKDRKQSWFKQFQDIEDSADVISPTGNGKLPKTYHSKYHIEQSYGDFAISSGYRRIWDCGSFVFSNMF